MSDFEPVSTLAELDELDRDEMYEGEESARRGESEPDASHTRAYWHGWRETMIEMGKLPSDAAYKQLAGAKYMRRFQGT